MAMTYAQQVALDTYRYFRMDHTPLNAAILTLHDAGCRIDNEYQAYNDSGVSEAIRIFDECWAIAWRVGELASTRTYRSRHWVSGHTRLQWREEATEPIPYQLVEW